MIILNMVLMIVNGITALVSFTHYWRIRVEEYLLFTVVFFSAVFHGFYNSVEKYIRNIPVEIFIDSKTDPLAFDL